MKNSLLALLLLGLLLGAGCVLPSINPWDGRSTGTGGANTLVTNITITPTPLYIGTILKCTIGATSDQNATLNLSYGFQKNGVNQTSLAGVLVVANNSTTVINLTLTGGLTIAGDNWSCTGLVRDENYSSALNYSSNLTVLNASVSNANFSIYYAGNAQNATYVFPFPTIGNITPYGQTARVGILNVRNNVSAVLKNYTIALNQSAPAGVSIYARCDRLSFYNGTWTNLTTSPYQCLTNINSTNLTAYMWSKADADNATVNESGIAFKFVVTEVG